MPLWNGKISILVPVYNAETTLNACVNSVLCQGDGNFELVLVDDGATDGSGALCDALSAAHPNCIRAFHQENRGLIMARRQGVALAEGAYCLFLDSDDMLSPDCLKTVRAIIGDTGADIVIFNYDNLYEPTGERETDEVIFPDGSLFEGEGKKTVYEEMIRSWRLNNLCMKAIRTPLVKQDDTPYGAYAHLQIGEDLLQSLYPVTHAARIVYTARPLYVYRHKRSSMIGSLGSRTEREDDAIGRRFQEYIRLWGMDTPATRRISARRLAVNVLTDFFQAYRAADTPEKRREVVCEDWRTRIDPDWDLGALEPIKRVELWAVKHKCYPLLWLFERLGGRRIRRQYAE